MARRIIEYLEEVASLPDEQLANQRGPISAAQSRAIEENIVACLRPAAGERILELGCGTGMIAGALHSRGARVVCADVAHNMLLRAIRKGPGVQGVRATCTALPFRDNSFDKVSFNAVITFLSADDVMATLGELRRIVRSGGTIFVGDICDPPREIRYLRYVGVKGWRLLARLTVTGAKNFIRPIVGFVWGSRRRGGGWYSPREFLRRVHKSGMRGSIRQQNGELPYHGWRYDCLLQVEK